MEFQIVFLCMLIGLAFISIFASSQRIPDLAGHDLTEEHLPENENATSLKSAKKRAS